MSELTKERLEEIASGQNTVSIPEAAELARELLSLRTRDAGDDEKMFPLQTSRQAPPGPRQIPWSVAEIAYGEYSRRYGKGQSLERLAERGGFGWCEMDMYYPDWRKDVSEIESLRQQLREAREEIERLKGLYEQAMRERDAVTGELVSLQNKLTLDEGQFVGEDNSDPPQVWVWDGARSEFESAEPSRRLPFTRRQKPKEVCDE